MKKFYAEVALIVMMAALAATGCPNPAGEDAVHAISLDQTGTYTFPGADAGYGAQAAKTVTVTNTGNRVTGALTVEKSGANADSFTVSKTNLGSIAVNWDDSFTVAPVAGLAAGTYTATISVNGGNNISESFDVSFTVKPPADPIYGISLSETGTHIFTAATVGYGSAPTAYSVTVTNTGKQATGTLVVGKSGANADSFTVSASSLSSIAANENSSFTVAPVTGLGAATYAATITVSGENNISESFAVSFTVNSTTPTYSVGLSETETYAFPVADAGYGTQTARTVTVTNTGNQATGALSVGKSGANAASFTVSASSLSSIAIGGTGSFTVVPVTGLASGTYSATITVSGGNSISASFTASFTVNSITPVYDIGLSENGTYAFPGAAVGYGAQTARTVTVTNTGNQATGALSVGKSGANAASFTVSAISLSSIAVGGTGSFTVLPVTGLAVGTYNATIMVSGGNSISASFAVSFSVSASTWSVSLSETGTYDFPEVFAGYGTQTAKLITVTNTGNQATGALNIVKSGSNASSFTVSAISPSSIAVGGIGNFTVVPIEGLAAGTYVATITVSGGNSISEGFVVSFTVNPVGTPAWSVSFSETGPHTFPAAVVGYGAQGAKTLTINNTGNQATGPLNIGVSNTNFTVSKTGISNIEISVSDNFTVVPVAELAVGIHTATITVNGTNGINASFNVSFTVTPAPVYSIGLNPSGTHTFPGASVGYGTQTARTVTVTNTGNQATGALNIVKSGANAASFTVSAISLGSIAVSGNDSFTVVPITELVAGTYDATITVSGGNSISASFNVRFTVSLDLSSNANLAALSINPGWLDQTFNPDNTAYTVTVPNTTTSIEVSAAPADFGKAAYEQFPTANPVSLSVGATTIRVRVTAEDGTTRDYTITVTRTPLSANANLGSLSVDVGELTPSFSANTTAYTVLVPDTTGYINVSGAVADTGKATLIQSPANPVVLGAGATVITLTVTAENGTATKTYTITVNKSTATEAVNVVIGMADELIDLTRSTENDLSQEAGNILRLTAPAGYTNYVWRVDGNTGGYNTVSERVIELNANWYWYNIGTHSVLLEYEKDNVLYGCEVQFRVTR